MSKDTRKIAICLLIAAVAWIGMDYIAFRSGASYQRQRDQKSYSHTATYNDGWTDGVEDLLTRQWDAHHAGTECK